mmetsp:Transcript_47570/g.123195  ORF Transcript_47570/g.123195 Transcript_47570/m.123195 type:complete len:203 (-) Transcript_47570:2374-2982(-)
MRLRALKCTTAIFRDEEELHCTAEVTPLFAKCRNQLCAFQTPCLPHNGEGFLWPAQLLQVQSHNRVHILCPLVCLFGLFVLLLCLSRTCKLGEQLGRGNVLDEGLSRVVVLCLKVERYCLVVCFAPFVQRSCITPLLHPLQYSSAISVQVDIARLIHEADTALDVAQPEGVACKSCPALCNVLFGISFSRGGNRVIEKRVDL